MARSRGPAARFVDAGARLTVAPGEEVVGHHRLRGLRSSASARRAYTLRIGELNRIPGRDSACGQPAGDRLPGPCRGRHRPPHDSPIRADPDRQIVVEPVAASVDVNAGPISRRARRRTRCRQGGGAAEPSPMTVRGLSRQRVLGARGRRRASSCDPRRSERRDGVERRRGDVAVRVSRRSGRTFAVVGAAGTADEISFSVVVPSPDPSELDRPQSAVASIRRLKSSRSRCSPASIASRRCMAMSATRTSSSSTPWPFTPSSIIT